MKKDNKNERMGKIMAKGVKAMSTAGAESRCMTIFHDVKKPEAVKNLKRF